LVKPHVCGFEDGSHATRHGPAHVPARPQIEGLD
jgi:hypothetical protein